MPLITDTALKKVFDITSVHKGDLIRAKYSDGTNQEWNRNGG